MKKVLKFFFTIGALVAVTGLLLAGCGNKTDGSGKIKLTLATNQYNTEPAYLELKKLAENYSKENPDVTVKVSILTDYEPTMKTRMAANDLPDMFFTHGWSTTRYAEYLEPLQNQEWANKINPLIKDQVTDSKGNVFVLPMDVAMSGIIFNKKVLNDAGVDWKTIKTWDDLKKASNEIKKTGKTPIGIGGLKDSWTVGNFMDFALPSYLVTDDKENERKKLLDGSFDWNNFSPFYDMFMNYYDSNFFNKNVMEGTNQDIIVGMAHNEIAFAFSGTGIAKQIAEIDPDVELGFIPVPSIKDDDQGVTISGESIAMGVWKDSKHKKEAIKFLGYLAKPENVNEISKINQSPTGLVGDGYETNAGVFDEYYKNASHYRAFGYFDRDYLPSGMWDTLTKAGEAMIQKTSTKKEVIDKFQADYDKLIKQ
jgi:raffinose/stachyose/melibiose transport system substrate-binding protein